MEEASSSAMSLEYDDEFSSLVESDGEETEEEVPLSEEDCQPPQRHATRQEGYDTSKNLASSVSLVGSVKSSDFPTVGSSDEEDLSPLLDSDDDEEYAVEAYAFPPSLVDVKSDDSLDDYEEEYDDDIPVMIESEESEGDGELSGLSSDWTYSDGSEMESNSDDSEAEYDDDDDDDDDDCTNCVRIPT